jgi:hypothetical protein
MKTKSNPMEKSNYVELFHNDDKKCHVSLILYIHFLNLP